MPRGVRKNKRENLMEEKRKLLEKLNAVDLQIEEYNKEVKDKWDAAFQKGMEDIRSDLFGDEYYSTVPVDQVLSCIKKALEGMAGEKEIKEEKTVEKAPDMEDTAIGDSAKEEAEVDPEAEEATEDQPEQRSVSMPEEPSENRFF